MLLFARTFFSLGEGTFTDVIDIVITIAEENMTIIRDHPTWKEWVNFESLSIARSTAADAPFSPDEIVASTGIGRIRTKGQGTLLFVGCQGGKIFPFSIKFDNGPFLGMTNFHLRSNSLDSSYMRDYAANEILRAVGLPHLRSRPARLFLNGEYHGFYSLHEAPDEDYVMQRSFGVSDPEKTGLFKMRDLLAECEFDTSLFDPNSPVPDPIYAERGRHRDAFPQIPEAATREETFMQCVEFFHQQKEKIWWDVGRAYLEYNQSCAVTMVETDMASRKFGPKSIDNSMINFLETYYDQENDDLTDFVDIDQWLQSFAFLSILVNSDSPLWAVNNWYLATTNEGSRDWKIFLYDFDHLLKQELEAGISPECGPLMAYSPIIRGGVSNQQPLTRRIFNSKDNMEKYLTHVREQVNILTNEKILDKLYRYGETIAAYASKDEYFSFRAMDPTPFPDITLEVFEKTELAKDTSEYNTLHNPFLPSLRFRLEQVQKQLDAIDSGTLPHNGEYNPSYICLDWRNPGEEKYPYIIADDCASPECTDNFAQQCYSTGCGDDGEFLNEFLNVLNEFLSGACLQMDEKCNSCFPYSRCGSALEVDESDTFVESDTCGPELAECALVASCFDHLSGKCAFDGEILWTDCLPSLSCAPCFPNSRCGSIDTPEGETEDSSSGSYGTTSSMLVTQILGSLIAGLAWCWMAVIA